MHVSVVLGLIANAKQRLCLVEYSLTLGYTTNLTPTQLNSSVDAQLLSVAGPLGCVSQCLSSPIILNFQGLIFDL